MPERLAPIIERIDTLLQAALFAFIGFGMAMAQLLMSNERPAWRIIVGRCLSNAGIAMAAGAVLLVHPEAPLLALVGVAAGLGTLGTAGLERLIQRVLGGKGEA